MADRDKVIKGLECCIHTESGYCPGECPYIKNFSCRGNVTLMADALELLNDTTEWNPVNPDRGMNANAFECNKCKRLVHFGSFVRECDYDFCPWCGRRTR